MHTGTRPFDGPQCGLMPVRSCLPEMSTLSSKFNAFKLPVNRHEVPTVYKVCKSRFLPARGHSGETGTRVTPSIP